MIWNIEKKKDQILLEAE